MSQNVKRVRGRVRFRTELPLKVQPAELDGSTLEAVLNLLSVDEHQREAAREGLLSIARSYQNSMRLAAEQAPRPDVSRTLDALADHSEAASHQLARAAASRRNVISQSFSYDLHMHEAGLPALEAVAEFFGYLAEELSSLDDHSHTLEAARTAEDLAVKMNLLPMQCQWELVLIQGHARLIPTVSERLGAVDLGTILGMRLGQLSRAAAILMKKRRGPRSNTAQMRAVGALRALFEGVSGRDATHHMKSGRHYTGRSETRFGTFVEAAFRMMQPRSAARWGLTDAISFELWNSRSQRKARDMERQHTKDDRDLQAALSAVGLPNFSPPN